MTARGRGGSAGFTLVELLVSLALTACAAMLLTAAMATGRSATQHAEAATAGGESVAAAQGVLRDAIERLLPDTSSAAGGAQRSDTQGDAARLTFLAPAPGNRADSGLLRYFLALGGDGTLDLATSDARDDGTTAARWTVQRLIGGVRGVDLGYFGRSGDAPPPRWRNAWTDQSNPPDLVRIRLRFAAGDARRWPELVVRPAATVSAGCELDRGTGQCRAS